MPGESWKHRAGGQQKAAGLRSSSDVYMAMFMDMFTKVPDLPLLSSVNLQGRALFSFSFRVPPLGPDLLFLFLSFRVPPPPLRAGSSPFSSSAYRPLTKTNGL